MNTIYQQASFLNIYLFILTAITSRYFLIATPLFAIFFLVGKNRFAHKRIQGKLPGTALIRAEIFYSILSIAILAAFGLLVVYLTRLGVTNIYTDLNEYGVAYFIASIVAILLLHDAYFYFAHRLMHVKSLYRFLHATHHRFRNPTPFASFAFQPTEALLQGFFGLIIAFSIPTHVYVVLIFMLLMNIMNSLGHLGHEIFPVGFSRGIGGMIFNTPTHHNMHHQYVHCNYGLYFNWWDRIFQTNHSRYHEVFDEVAGRTEVSCGYSEAVEDTGLRDRLLR